MHLFLRLKLCCEGLYHLKGGSERLLCFIVWNVYISFQSLTNSIKIKTNYLKVYFLKLSI